MNRKKINVKGMSIKTGAIISAVFALAISASLIASLFIVADNYNSVKNSTIEYEKWEKTAADVQLASDYLTEQVRSYVVTQDEEYLKNYFYEADVAQRRQKAFVEMESYLKGTSALDYIETATNESYDLMKTEYYAMRLTLESQDIVVDDKYPKEIRETSLSPEDEALSDSDKAKLAVEKVYDNEYKSSKDIITTNVNAAVEEINEMKLAKINSTTEHLRIVLIVQQTLVGANIIFIFALLILIYFYFVKPINRSINCLLKGKRMDTQGSLKEMNYLSATYNEIRDQNISTNQRLEFEANHDGLTKLYNRKAYDNMFRKMNLSETIFILLDADNFKGVNDEYGHEVGDKVLAKIGDNLTKFFYKENERCFRLGGDEFAVLIEGASEGEVSDIKRRCENMFLVLNNVSDVPPITMSAGVAHGKEWDSTDSLYKKADIALYNVKKTGKNGVEVYRKKERTRQQN